MPTWTLVITGIVVLGVILFLLRARWLFLRAYRARDALCRPVTQAIVSTNELENTLPPWIGTVASTRGMLAVCPICDDFQHQVMTAWVCWDIAYMLDECRIAACDCCGAERLCFCYLPQEHFRRTLDFAWGIAAPSAKDVTAFLADKLNAWREALCVYRIAQAHQRGQDKVAMYAAMGWGDYGVRHLE